MTMMNSVFMHLLPTKPLEALCFQGGMVSVCDSVCLDILELQRWQQFVPWCELVPHGHKPMETFAFWFLVARCICVVWIPVEWDVVIWQQKTWYWAWVLLSEPCHSSVTLDSFRHTLRMYLYGCSAKNKNQIWRTRLLLLWPSRLEHSSFWSPRY